MKRIINLILKNTEKLYDSSLFEIVLSVHKYFLNLDDTPLNFLFYIFGGFLQMFLLYGIGIPIFPIMLLGGVVLTIKGDPPMRTKLIIILITMLVILWACLMVGGGVEVIGDDPVTNLGEAVIEKEYYLIKARQEFLKVRFCGSCHNITPNKCFEHDEEFYIYTHGIYTVPPGISTTRISIGHLNEMYIHDITYVWRPHEHN